MHTSHFRHRLVEFWAVGVTFLSLINYTQGVGAINYGSGSYNGSCSYGCAGSSPVTAPSTDTSTLTVSEDSSTTNTSSASRSTNATSSSDGSLTITSVGQAKPTDLDPYSNFANGAGQTLNLSKDAVFLFTLAVSDSEQSGISGDQSTSKTETHTITINNISDDSVLFTVASTPNQYLIKLHETLLIDVNGDSKKDLGIELTSITLPTASLRIWRIIPVVPFTTSAQAQRAIETRNLLRALSIIIGSIIILLMLPGSVFRWILARFGRGDHHDHNHPGGSGTNWGGPYVQEPIPVHHSRSPTTHASLGSATFSRIDVDAQEINNQDQEDTLEGEHPTQSID